MSESFGRKGLQERSSKFGKTVAAAATAAKGRCREPLPPLMTCVMEKLGTIYNEPRWSREDMVSQSGTALIIISVPRSVKARKQESVETKSHIYRRVSKQGGVIDVPPLAFIWGGATGATVFITSSLSIVCVCGSFSFSATSWPQFSCSGAEW
jgi:hypothetical protein